MDKLIGTGQYLAYESHFACRDDRESFWRLSKLTMSTTKLGEMTFTYVGEFASQTDIERYLRDIPQVMVKSEYPDRWNETDKKPEPPLWCFCDFCNNQRI